MAKAILQRLFKSRSGAFLTLFALWLLSPGSIQAAGCFHDNQTASHFDLLVKAGAMIDSPGVRESTRAGQPPKCNGPLCSRGPAVPSSSPWVVSASNNSWAYLVEERGQTKTLLSRFEPVTEPDHSVARDTSIFHPPRVAH
jgi:hypothetical protein